jgi:anti-anti-sigma factor
MRVLAVTVTPVTAEAHLHLGSPFVSAPGTMKTGGHMKAEKPEPTSPPAVDIELRGEHDLSTEPRVTQALAATAGYGRVLVDLSECTFADSALVAALGVAREDMRRRDGRIEVVIPPAARAARRLAELTQLADIVPIYESLDAVIGDPR